MTAQPLDDVDPIAKHGMPSDAAIQAAGEIYGAILADPERAEQIRAARAAAAATKPAEPLRGTARRPATRTTN